MAEDLAKISRAIKQLVRNGSYEIDPHALFDHPEREIFADDILEVIKTGSITQEESSEGGKTSFYVGETRYRWIGQDIKDRVLRLIVLIKELDDGSKVLIISSATADKSETKKYLEEDKP